MCCVGVWISSGVGFVVFFLKWRFWSQCIFGVGVFLERRGFRLLLSVLCEYAHLGYLGWGSVGVVIGSGRAIDGMQGFVSELVVRDVMFCCGRAGFVEVFLSKVFLIFDFYCLLICVTDGVSDCCCVLASDFWAFYVVFCEDELDCFFASRVSSSCTKLSCMLLPERFVRIQRSVYFPAECVRLVRFENETTRSVSFRGGYCFGV
ncbi:hypothetical protein M758_7G049000 [Ceratodon purpureus]|nr:hypothetical protein M758_7G049000 [Ceratodon purpureus]